jgi:hypothetical protein
MPLWWRHTGWKPKVDVIMSSIAKSKNNTFLVVDGEMQVMCWMLWLFSTLICLYVGNVHLCATLLALFLCFLLVAIYVVCLCLHGYLDGQWPKTGGMEEDKNWSYEVWLVDAFSSTIC